MGHHVDGADFYRFHANDEMIHTHVLLRRHLTLILLLVVCCLWMSYSNMDILPPCLNVIMHNVANTHKYILFYCNCEEVVHILSSIFNCTSILHYALIISLLSSCYDDANPNPKRSFTAGHSTWGLCAEGNGNIISYLHFHITVIKATYFITLVRGALSCSMRSPPSTYTTVMSIA